MDRAILEKSILALFSALLGAGLIFFIKLDHKKLCSLISVSAGALLGAAVVGILPEASINLSSFQLMISTFSGYLLFWVISKYYFHVCPACSASHFDEQTTKRFSEIVLLLFTALSFHSFLDGIALSTGGITAQGKANSILIAVLAHKFPEGLALASLMVGANYAKSKIIKYVFLVESATVLGALVGDIFLAKYFNLYWLAFVEAHIAGGFVYLSFHAVFGELLKNHKALVIISFITGLLVIFGVSLV
ncbi:MAG: hypothetical protein COW85_01180 [Ignavibacteria bacterium CG22_combo_CG10-13_8_21_14_all_37_15]|nr:ZIP family metal transporter [Ignavibacteria bacterium]OIO18363.1 MAG: hypothetical protein AUJ54_08330 [Ignavibacteria bacterium CG1_02_37_35]PIP79454.1 MAG: hypothetical protein COW85_01180 [Ignavibacteria bacterium CG22_combo_CG10-13_8_21_14_all_37_15]PIS43904.1 MAG: hypothetical protein COT22_13405 [Ignavibacteria bacterium CG08_land_8_20_14_0_20_37_9]PIX94990.1 MAG: hypothetical protein COZ25_02830 [Ignavibacteria bacterium CG_4_10_14_3_um_filter_37_18]PJC61071.1 MAG: hypothetical prot